MLHCSLWLCRPAAAAFSVSATALSARTGARRRSRTWQQPDVRQFGNTPKVHRLRGVLQLTQHGLPDPAAHRGGHTYEASGQVSLLSRPGGRVSRLSDPAARFHYQRRTPRPPRFNGRAFRQYFNSS
ncbi:hypothetical protein NESM_000344600 [Novymonas esmeraldas]|uniref:Secreted protein n=1 Tax=Novymonas esmeraldas TaxID=1808958 RepID=A0AAW0EKY9_9TRYP